MRWLRQWLWLLVVSLISVLFDFFLLRDRANRFIENNDEMRCGMFFSPMMALICTWSSHSSWLFSHNGLYFCFFLFFHSARMAKEDRKILPMISGQFLLSHTKIMMIRFFKEIVILYFFNVTIITWLNCPFAALRSAQSDKQDNMTKFDFFTVDTNTHADVRREGPRYAKQKDLIDWI